jgi:ATP-dependent Clp endopeptidase proteolytic subunit ClpP
MALKNCEEQEAKDIISTVCDEESREVYLTGTVDLNMYQTLSAAIKHLDKTKGNITLIINTAGGEAPAGFAIADTIKLTVNKVVAQCFGECMSIGMTILQACDLRLASPSCRLMIHNGSLNFPDLTFSQAKNQMKEIQGVNDQVCGSLFERSNLTLKEVETLCDKETFMSAEVAMGYGFLDGIMEPVKNKKKKGKK